MKKLVGFLIVYIEDPFKFIITQKMQIREQTEIMTSDQPQTFPKNKLNLVSPCLRWGSCVREIHTTRGHKQRLTMK